MSAEGGRFILDGQRLPYEPGDTVAVAIVRAGEVTRRRRHLSA